MKAYLAPAGTPLRLREIVAGAVPAAVSGRAAMTLARKLQHLSGTDRCLLLASGRAAMTVLMAAIKELAAPEGREEVIVPGYTCYSVPASIGRAGLKLRLCDVDPETLSLDMAALERFDFRRVAAIVTANLYGIPNDLAALEALAAHHGVRLIDDAAQALGARVGDRAVGSFGAAGIYSFDKGKNITTMQGGAVLIRDDALGERLVALHEALPGAGTMQTAALLLKLGVYAVALRPSIYEYIQRISALGLGKTVYEDDFPIHRYSECLSGVGLKLFARLDELTDTRVENAGRIREALGAFEAIRFLRILPDATPVFTRLPVFVADAEARERIVAALHDDGIGATLSYPSPLCDVPEVIRLIPASDRELPGARAIARSVVTLPTHPYCPADIAQRIAHIIAPILGH